MALSVRMTTICRNKKAQKYLKIPNISKISNKAKLEDRESGCDLRNVVLRIQRQILRSLLSGGIDLKIAFVICPSQSK